MRERERDVHLFHFRMHRSHLHSIVHDWSRIGHFVRGKALRKKRGERRGKWEREKEILKRTKTEREEGEKIKH